MALFPSICCSVPMRAFFHSALEYVGPFITVQGRGKQPEIRYLCLFTCLNTWTVHLEISFGIDTDAFLNLFYQFAGCRGLPGTVLLDNGINFVDREKELRYLVNALNHDQIKEKTANKGVQWHFISTLATHWGGVHEFMVKSAKRAIKSMLQNASVADEELMTAFVGAEALISLKPLIYQSANPADCIPLTPNHFQDGQIGGEFAPESLDTNDFNPRNGASSRVSPKLLGLLDS